MINTIYKVSKPLIFNLMDGETAHKWMIKYAQFLDNYNLIHTNGKNLKNIDISNAAGFDKNAEIPIRFMESLGFTRTVIGTVTNKPWEGNPDQFIIRYPKTQSMKNYLGLPNLGSKHISENLRNQNITLPITLNIAPTPNKEELLPKLNDLEATLKDFKDIKEIDRIEYNAFCPNTKSSLKFHELPMILEVLERNTRYDQAIYLKLSPDLNYLSIEEIIEIANEFDKVRGLTLTNTTKVPSKLYINDKEIRGGASGDAVYEKSLKVQQMTERIMLNYGKKLNIIAVGGINSPEKLNERTTLNTTGYQIFTPLIYKGPGLIKELRS